VRVRYRVEAPTAHLTDALDEACPKTQNRRSALMLTCGL
jgi:hypothetical protein